MVRAVVLLLALLGCACTESRSEQCRRVCAREAECYDSLGTPDNFDEGECLDTCAALERDHRAQELVTSHARCVADAVTCEAVIACP